MPDKGFQETFGLIGMAFVSVCVCVRCLCVSVGVCFPIFLLALTGPISPELNQWLLRNGFGLGACRRLAGFQIQPVFCNGCHARLLHLPHDVLCVFPATVWPPGEHGFYMLLKT